MFVRNRLFPMIGIIFNLSMPLSACAQATQAHAPAAGAIVAAKLSSELVVGVAAWLLAGSVGGKVDAVIGPGLVNIVIVITLFSWYYPARIVRNTVKSLRTAQFVEAAVSSGAGDARIMLRELLPHLMAPIIVYSTGVISSMIVFEAGLSYLRLGVPPPTPSWGQMISDGVSNGLYRVQPWLAIVPGAMLALTTLAFNQLGDGIRDALAPKSGRGTWCCRGWRSRWGTRPFTRALCAHWWASSWTRSTCWWPGQRGRPKGASCGDTSRRWWGRI